MEVSITRFTTYSFAHFSIICEYGENHSSHNTHIICQSFYFPTISPPCMLRHHPYHQACGEAVPSNLGNGGPILKKREGIFVPSCLFSLLVFLLFILLLIICLQLVFYPFELYPSIPFTEGRRISM